MHIINKVISPNYKVIITTEGQLTLYVIKESIDDISNAFNDIIVGKECFWNPYNISKDEKKLTLFHQ